MEAKNQLMKKVYTIALIATLMASCQSQTKQETMEAKNQTVEDILNRRSTRAYKPEQIRAEDLDLILQCAINAPSALNKQSWEVRVIQKPELINAINEGFVKYASSKRMEGNASKSQEPNFSVFHGAPTVIVVANDTKNDYSEVDCGLLGQNILVSAESMNLGTCVVGGVIAYLSTPEAKDLVAQLNLPLNYKPLYTITIGYKNQWPDAKPRDKTKIQIIK